MNSQENDGQHNEQTHRHSLSVSDSDSTESENFADELIRTYQTEYAGRSFGEFGT